MMMSMVLTLKLMIPMTPMINGGGDYYDGSDHDVGGDARRDWQREDRYRLALARRQKRGKRQSVTFAMCLIAFSCASIHSCATVIFPNVLSARQMLKIAQRGLELIWLTRMRPPRSGPTTCTWVVIVTLEFQNYCSHILSLMQSVTSSLCLVTLRVVVFSKPRQRCLENLAAICDATLHFREPLKSCPRSGKVVQGRPTDALYAALCNCSSWIRHAAIGTFEGRVFY